MRSLDERLDQLVARLDDGDPRAVRHAGEQILMVGVAAVPRLAAVLADGGAEARKAAAFLLGRLAGREASGARDRERLSEGVTALRAALGDAEPKVRKNAAVALGKVQAGAEGEGADSATAALATALEGEEIAWVRPSLVLALGAVGGAAARTALNAVTAASDAEADALGKARDRVREATPEVGWRTGVATPVPIWAAVPSGLEDVAADEAAASHLRLGLEPPGARVGPEVEAADGSVAPGRIRLTAGAPTAGVLARLRCVLDLRLLLAEAPTLHDADPDDVAARVADLVSGAPLLAGWRDVLEAEGGTLHYRFALDDLRLPKRAFLAVLGAVRDVLAPHGLRDSPSHYGVQLTVEAGRRATRLWLIPTFLADERFAYRREDVGASVQPVVAAGLVRLLRGPAAPRRPDARGRSVFDPTCGSATLLIERAKLEAREARAESGIDESGPPLHLRGIDASPTAVRAAQANLRAAGLAGRISVDRADATDPRSWSPVDEVIANLPFGRRSRSQDEDLERLYDRLAGHLAASLRPGGRALLYTSDRDRLAAALARHAPDLRLAGQRTVESGGIRVGVWLLLR